MIYLRHKNGNGKYYGYDAVIDCDSYLGKNSRLFDKADVWQSQIIDSAVAYTSKVRNSVLLHSKVGSEHYESEVVDSRLKHSFVEGGTVLGAVLTNAYVSSHCVVTGGYLENAHLRDAVIIENQAIVKNVMLHGKMRIGYGTWERPPRYFEIKDDVIDCGVTESTEGFAYIGCQRKKIKDWLHKKHLFGKVEGWSDDLIDEIGKLGEWL
jgi:hypothetical protein